MDQPSAAPSINERILQLEEEVSRLESELAILRSQKHVDKLLKADGPIPRENRTVVRTEQGLTIKGTRLTLYYVMDEMRANNSLKNARDIFELTDAEMLDILDYIHLHKEEVEKEYRDVLRSAEENRTYWEERNKGLTKTTYEQREAVLAKLREWSAQYHASHKA